MEKRGVAENGFFLFWQSAYHILKVSWQVGPVYMVFRILILLAGAGIPILLLDFDRQILDSLTNRENVAFVAILSIVIMIGLVRFMDDILNVLQTTVFRIFNIRISDRLYRNLTNKSGHFKITAFDSPQVMDKMRNARQFASGAAAEKNITEMMKVITQTIRIIGISAVLFHFSFILGMLALVSVIPEGILIVRNLSKTDDLEREFQRTKRKMNYYYDTIIKPQSGKEVRLYGIGNYLYNNRNSYYKEYESARLNLIAKRQIWGFFTGIFRVLFQTAVPMLILFNYIAAGNLSVGEFIMYSGNILLLAVSISSIFASIGWASVSSKQYNDYKSYLGLPLDARRGLPVKQEWIKTPPKITFDHVYYRYSNSQTDVIKDVSFTIEPAEKVALIGLNGVGKTTIIKLLAGLYEPTQGRILLDDKDMAEYDQEQINHLFSVIFQDYIKEYWITLREMVCLGCEEKLNDDKAIMEAFQSFGIDYILNEPRVPKGLDNMVGNDFNGVVFSGGESQKLVLSRALLQNRSVFVLDEPTSALDPFAETKVLEKFIIDKPDHSCVVVSHRLSCGTMVDKVIVIKDGTVAEVGTHDELLDSGGEYATLFRMQAEKYNAM